MIKAAIFDLDGTLLDSIKDLEDACNYALSHFNMPHVNSQRYKLLLGKGRRKIIESIVGEFFGNDEEKIIDEFLSYYNEYYSSHMFNNTKPYDGILDMLDYLNSNNIITAVLSNKPHDFTQSLVSHFFKDKIKIVYGLQNGYEAKPDPCTLLEIINILGLKKHELIYIGDTEIDIQVAKNANVKSLGVLWGFRTASLLESEGADYIASTIDEMKQIIINN
ncbi:MAG: HAD family hydrolase [Sedimentibacter sp.]|uniref:HAD family hydrolase n=1 Tax=Sedimentibacter sp. TaxID=1960295 RepID=UPI0029829414|nr:HAD family hydrolase [Sedimentibacter sp.]MDW5300437.1 HAD family hydrolase [Sedimentibacter sp.]